MRLFIFLKITAEFRLRFFSVPFRVFGQVLSRTLTETGHRHYHDALLTLFRGGTLTTVVGVLIEVPLMLMLVRICLKTTHWFKTAETDVTARQPTIG